MAVAYAFGTLSIQVSLVGAFVSVLAGLVLALLREVERSHHDTAAALQDLHLMLPVMASAQLRNSFRDISASLRTIATSNDALFRTLAEERVGNLCRDFRTLSRKKLVYIGTEAWRTAYADVLQQDGISEYHSVSWVRSPNYWQDQPGLQSLRINCELAGRGVAVTRIMIERATAGMTEQNGLPPQIDAWLRMQHKAGIRLMTVQEQALGQEEDLLVDFGIYGTSAVGILDTDSQSRTLEFRLSFDPADIEVYAEKWERLLLYAKEWAPSSSSHS
ncbi:MAG: hypothetical protein Fues2KO_04420 [Fuerstiella sp.]